MNTRKTRGKIKENERKWEINDKKELEKQFTTFVSSVLFSSYTHTL